MVGDRTRIGLWTPQVGLAGGRGGIHVHYAMHVPPERYDAAVAALRERGQEVEEHRFPGLRRQPRRVRHRPRRERRRAVDLRRRQPSGMKVTVRLFADPPPARRPRHARARPARGRARRPTRSPRSTTSPAGCTLVMAVNREYAAADHPLAAGDELALIPPVSGGATTAPHVAIRDEPLSLDARRRARARPARGRRRGVRGRHPRRRLARLRGLRGDGDRADARRSSPPRSSATGCARRRPSTASAACR